MQTSRRQWLEFAGAVTLLVLSTGLGFAQGGGPPKVPKCTQCKPTPGQCDNQTASGENCCCCLSGELGDWSCHTWNAGFDCSNPPPGWSSCFRVL